MTQFAFVFPGQGSQTVGMLSEMAANYPVIEETFREASDALGYDLWALTQQGPAEELNKTWQTQPALLAASVALWRVWQQQDGKAPTLAEACRDLFSFTPELGGTEQEALACGLVFCALCDRTLHLTKKSAAR